jgi:hypothetical protein
LALRSYLRHPWNCLDFFVVLTSVISLTVTSTRFVNGIKALRALRPLRLISNFESTRQVRACFLNCVLLLCRQLCASLLAGCTRSCPYALDQID